MGDRPSPVDSLPRASLAHHLGRSQASRLAEMVHFGGLLIALDLLQGDGIEQLGLLPGNAVRREVLAACGVAYFVRSVRRARADLDQDMPSARGLAAAGSQILLALFGGTSPAQMSSFDVGALELFAIGWLLGGRWFGRRETALLGDLLLALGYALFARRAIVIVVPAGLLAYHALAGLRTLLGYPDDVSGDAGS